MAEGDPGLFGWTLGEAASAVSYRSSYKLAQPATISLNDK
jgi:hypothetical protein